ncbi:MAG: MEDS domain-containing protein [Pseudonocardiales bacterium]|nr:MEDS domain-containing protein [Pseudonocardiales bacterium]MBV9031421.1 MEDS domain-containing protein [Pseudonocardiales bacterium]MBW0009047.1 MEDS domain-containing protein [Pseudonocardiales bacterium]
MTAPARRWADDFAHPALFYRGTAEYLKGTVPFIREGLAAGEPVALAVPGPNLRLILTELGTDAERVRLLDMTRSGRNPGRIIPNVLRAFADAHPSGRVRIIGEHLWTGRTPTEYPACAQQEILINIALAGRSVTMLCPYDVDRVGPQTLAEAEAGHPQLIDASGERVSTGFAPEHVVTDDDRLCSPAGGPVFTFDATKAALAGQFACDHAVRLGLSGDHAELKLIVGELVARRLVPGALTGTLRLWAERGYLVCEVRHSGHIDDPLADHPPAEPSRPDGRGLLLVHHLSDLVQQRTHPQGTTTRVYLKLPPAEGLPDGPGEPAAAPPRTRPALPAGPTPLPWQTYEALHAAERFGRYVPQDATTDTTRPVAASSDARLVEPVLEALTAVETLARVVDRWRARLVRLARTRGAPWIDIGQSLGVSKQAAHERYGRARRRSAGGPGLPGHACPPPPVRGT